MPTPPRPPAETCRSWPSVLVCIARFLLSVFSRWVCRFSVGGSGAEQGLDGAALVHRPVALGGLVEGQGQVEHLARVDDPVLDKADQVGQEPADRGGAAVQVHLGVEKLLAWQLDAVGDSAVADVAAGRQLE